MLFLANDWQNGPTVLPPESDFEDRAVEGIYQCLLEEEALPLEGKGLSLRKEPLKEPVPPLAKPEVFLGGRESDTLGACLEPMFLG